MVGFVFILKTYNQVTRNEVNKNLISLAVSFDDAALYSLSFAHVVCHRHSTYSTGLFISWVRLRARECENHLKFRRGEMLKQLCHVKKTELERLINDARQRTDMKT